MGRSPLRAGPSCTRRLLRPQEWPEWQNGSQPSSCRSVLYAEVTATAGKAEWAERLRERATRTPCVMLKGLVQLLVLVVLVLWERGGGGSRLRR